MKASTRRAVGLLALAAALVSPPSFPVEKEALEALRSRIERLRNQIADAEETRAEARDSLRDSEQAISDANRALRELSRQRKAAQSDLQTTTSSKTAIVAEVGARSDQLGRLLAARYLRDDPSYAKLLLSGADPQKTARDVVYLGYVSRAEADLIRTLRARLASLAEIEQRARAKTAEIAGIETARARSREELLNQRLARRRVLQRVSAQIRAGRKHVKILERDEARLSRLVEGLSRVIAATPAGRLNDKLPERTAMELAFDRLKGSLRLPVRGELANRFGAPRSGRGPLWKGLFIRSPQGQEVRAVASGRVVYADWMRGFGNLLIIDHGQGYLSIYGNNESVLKSVGDEIHTGDVVATVGASGGNTESGLYFEIRHEGKAFDPLKWVALQ